MTIFAAADSGAYAQDLEPRASANPPVGLNFLIVGYGYSEGGVATDPSLPLQDANVQLHGAVFAYACSLGCIEIVGPGQWNDFLTRIEAPAGVDCSIVSKSETLKMYLQAMTLV
jgi:hypothetical protein